MPGSKAEFQDVYGALIDQRCNCITADALLEVTSDEDALLLLMAIVSDLIYLRTSLGQIVHTDRWPDQRARRGNPFAPLSSHTELERMENILSLALDRWYRQVHECVSAEIMAFYYYCRLYLTCPHVLNLPSLAGYPDARTPPISSYAFSVSEEAVRLAWLVLDSAAMRSQLVSGGCLCPIWLPIVVFHAGLVLWAKHTFSSVQIGEPKGVRKMLLQFKQELDGMPWPCCEEMAKTIGLLMDTPIFEATVLQRN